MEFLGTRHPSSQGKLSRRSAPSAVTRDWVVQLDAFAARLADQAFATGGHVFLEAPAMGVLEIGMQRHHRPFVDQPDPVDRQRVTVGSVDLREL